MVFASQGAHLWLWLVMLLQGLLGERHWEQQRLHPSSHVTQHMALVKQPVQRLPLRRLHDEVM